MPRREQPQIEKRVQNDFWRTGATGIKCHIGLSLNQPVLGSSPRGLTPKSSSNSERPFQSGAAVCLFDPNFDPNSDHPVTARATDSPLSFRSPLPPAVRKATAGPTRRRQQHRAWRDSPSIGTLRHPCWPSRFRRCSPRSSTACRSVTSGCTSPKLDGFRGMPRHGTSGHVQVLSRNLRDLASSFPELVQAALSLRAGTLLDGTGGTLTSGLTTFV